MPPANPAKLPPLAFVVATTPITSPTNPSIARLGIGHGGTLPWPRIKPDMSFFARITTRPPSQTPNAINAVIMGRKTYDSLPLRFRPLPKRLNVIITRDESGMVRERAVAEWRAARVRERMRELEEEKKNEKNEIDESEITKSVEKEEPAILVSNNIETALTTLRDDFNPFSNNGQRGLGSVLVIGGGEIYASSLKLDPAGLGYRMRIVLTDVRRPGSEKDDPADSTNGFECDTFFPINDLSANPEWRQVSAEEVSGWVGEEIPDGWVWERNVAVRFLGFERK